MKLAKVACLVLIGAGVRKAIKFLRRKPACPLIEDHRLVSVRGKIIECLKKSSEWKKDVANMRQASKAFRRFVNSTIPHVNTNRIASIGGSINSLLAFLDVSSLEVDFGEMNVDPETLLEGLRTFHQLRSLSLSNVQLPSAVAEKMWNLTGLRKLSFHHVEMQALSFLFGLKSLTQLHLYDVSVVQPSLECLTELTELKLLTVDYCDELLQNNFHWIAHSASIRNVSLTLQVFTYDDVVNLSVLNAELALTINGLYSQGSFSSLLSLPTLKSLSLKSCDLESLQFPTAELQAVKHLSVSIDNVSASDFTNLVIVRNQLRSLILELTNTDKITLGVLCRSNFPLISLSFSMGVLEVDESLGLCTNLEALTIRGTHELFSSENLTCLRSLTKLREFTIVGCANWAPILQVLPDFGGNLKTLVIDWSSITEADLQVISQTCSLQSLALIRCTTLSSLEPLTELQSLRHLTVDCCLALEANLHTELTRPFVARLNTLHLRSTDGSSFEDGDEMVKSLRQNVPFVVFEKVMI